MLKNPPILTVRRVWQRPDAFHARPSQGRTDGPSRRRLAGTRRVGFGHQGARHRQCHVRRLRASVRDGPNDNLAILAAVSLAQPGDVIMAASEGFTQSAVVGDNVTLLAKAKGVVAIVIDGMARDLAGIAPIGLPVFARGITPNSCVRSGPGKVGLPIIIGGTAVEAGDIVIGDADGVVVLPRKHLQYAAAADRGSARRRKRDAAKDQERLHQPRRHRGSARVG